MLACSQCNNPLSNNDTQPTISFERVASDATEGASFIYRLRLTNTNTIDVSFDWSVQHISTSTSDFTGSLTGSQLIRAGDTTTTIILDISDDSIYEGDEIFSLSITNVTGATPDRLTAGGSIIDNDAQPTIAFEQVTRDAIEDTSYIYRLWLTNTSTTNITFDWSVQHISTSTGDFARAASFSGLETISAGDTAATITLQIKDDDLPEPAETFTLSITNITGATPSNLLTLITILESDVDDNGNGLIDLTTQEQLHNIRYNVAGTSYKTSISDAGVTCRNVCRGYELLANITLSTNWQPIGSVSKPFTSILQGNGYSIANLVVDGGNNIGLFAALSGATIDNLVVEVVSITGDSNVGALAGRAVNSIINKVQIRAANVNSKLHATGTRVGGMLGEIIGVTITNVTSDLDVVGGNDDNADYVGGIAGFVSSSSIRYTYSSGSVVASNNVDYVGGLLGAMSTSSDLSYSSASGSVTSSGNGNLYYGGLVGQVKYSNIRHSSASGNVIGTGSFIWFDGGLVGIMTNNSSISYSSASGNVSSSGNSNNYYGGLVGYVEYNSAINDSSASGSVTSSGYENDYYGGLVGYINDNSTISYSSASASVSSNGNSNNHYGGLAGSVNTSSNINYTRASGNISSNRNSNNHYGGLVGTITNNSSISYSSASGNVISSGVNSDAYGGLVGIITNNSSISYSSAIGNVISSGVNSDAYGGLVGESRGEVTHSWSSSSVFASSVAGLVGLNTGSLGFSYALGATPSSGFGLIAGNTNRFSSSIGTVVHSYWNSEISGALTAAPPAAISHTTNIASSDTVGMLASTGFAGASVFAGFLDATDELSREIWSFADGSYPVIRQLGADKQAVALAYGLLRLTHPTPTSDLNSFLGGTLNNEVITLDAADYSANEPLAILDINLLASNSVACVVGSGGSIITTIGTNQAVVTLSINETTSNNLLALIFDTDCSIAFDSVAVIQAGDKLQLDAVVSKGTASLTKKFVINFL